MCFEISASVLELAEQERHLIEINMFYTEMQVHRWLDTCCHSVLAWPGIILLISKVPNVDTTNLVPNLDTTDLKSP